MRLPSVSPVRPPRVRPRRALASAAGLALGLLGALPAVAATRLEGYYEAEIAAQKEDGRWHVGNPGDNGMPSHYVEFKMLSNPSDKFEIFSRWWAKSNRDDDRTSDVVDYYYPRWIDAEGHLKLKRGKAEAFVFFRQDRFYINDEPLLRLVDNGHIKNDEWGPKASGVRVDISNGEALGVKNLGATLIVADNGGTYSYNGVSIADGDDFYIARLRHHAWDRRLESGFMFLRKDWNNGSTAETLSLVHNDVVAADLAFSPRNLVKTGLRLGPLNLEQSRWTGEIAFSRRPYDEQLFGTPRNRQRAFAAEVRDLHMSDLTMHMWYRDIGEDFRDAMTWRFDGGGEYNRVQRHVEGIWLVPRKAVTTKVAWDSYRKRTPDEAGGDLRPVTEWYGEVYAEFVNGFKSRFAYKNWRGYDGSAEVHDYFTYPNWYGEVSVENSLAKIRLQGRIRDAGTFREVTAVGFDMNVNLTERLKGYVRAMNVNEETEARNTLFAQIKYDIGAGSELYFEYGDPGQSDNLVYTDWFVQESEQSNLRDRFKLLLRAWY